MHLGVRCRWCACVRAHAALGALNVHVSLNGRRIDHRSRRRRRSLISRFGHEYRQMFWTDDVHRMNCTAINSALDHRSAPRAFAFPCPALACDASAATSLIHLLCERDSENSNQLRRTKTVCNCHAQLRRQSDQYVSGVYTNGPQ